MKKSSNPLPKYTSQASPGAIGAQFQPVPTPVHFHDGMNTPKISYNNLTDLPAAVTTNSYGCSINSDGTGTLPTGWSSALATGDYTITHNLGTTSYGVAITMNGDTQVAAPHWTKSTNTFVVNFWPNSGGSGASENFDVLFTLIS